jgi:PAS domain S-box-containing protein
LENRRYQNILETAPYGYAYHQILFDGAGSPIDSIFLEVNPAFECLTGRSKAAIINRSALEVFPNFRNGDFNIFALYQRLADGDSCEAFEYHSRTLGKWLHVQAHSTERGYFSTIFIDITPQKQMESAVRQNEEKYRLIAENTMDTIWVLDLQSMRFTYISPAIAQLRGITVDESLAESLADGLTPESLQVVEEKIGRLLGDFLHNPADAQSYLTEIQQPHKDGRIIWVETSAKFRFNDAGKIEIVGVSRDISERKALEKALIEARDFAEQANKSKTLFLANMSHEIHTPLNGVVGFTNLLRSTLLDEIQKQYVDIAHDAAMDLLNVINEILDFSKIEAGGLDIHPVESDICKVLEEACDVIQYQAWQKGLELLLNIQPGLPAFSLVDPNRLKQVCVNLLSNAIKFTHDGEVELRVDFQRVDKHECYYTFAVRDTGIGIKPDQQEKIFEAFSQVDATTTREFAGSGLGLAISNYLVQKMGSCIKLESSPGKGSLFSFALKVPCSEAINQIWGFVKTPTRVLVVENHSLGSKIISEQLEFRGLEVVCVSTGMEAIEVLQQGKFFDLIIIDQVLPYISGIEVIHMIRHELGHLGDRQSVVLLYPFVSDFGLLEEAKKLNVRLALAKPIKPSDLYRLFFVDKPAKATEELEEGVENSLSALCPLLNISPTILVVEDIPVSRSLVCSLLKKMMPLATIAEAGDGVQAVKYFQGAVVDLVLMDIQMPNMDGLEATKAIRDIERGDYTPIISLTAGVTSYDRRRCADAGMDDFLSKPVIYDDLKNVMEKFLCG